MAVPALLGTTKRKLVDELVGWDYVVLLVDSFATRGIEHACHGKALYRRQAQLGCLWCPHLLGSPDLRRPATGGRSRLLARWLGHPRSGKRKFVRTVN